MDVTYSENGRRYQIWMLNGRGLQKGSDFDVTCNEDDIQGRIRMLHSRRIADKVSYNVTITVNDSQYQTRLLLSLKRSPFRGCVSARFFPTLHLFGREVPSLNRDTVVFTSTLLLLFFCACWVSVCSRPSQISISSARVRMFIVHV